MTDQGPMEPAHRAHAEAAERLVAAGRAANDDFNAMHEYAEAERERANAAEQRVKELEKERDDANFSARSYMEAQQLERDGRINAVRRADAAEAREQALRDRVSQLAADWKEAAPIWTSSGIRHDYAFDLLTLLSTAVPETGVDE